MSNNRVNINRNDRPTWQTFLAFATSWQIIVFLYLRDPQSLLACKERRAGPGTKAKETTAEQPKRFNT